MMEHDQNMIALNNHLQMTRLRQRKRYVIQSEDISRKDTSVMLYVSFCRREFFMVVLSTIYTGNIFSAVSPCVALDFEKSPPVLFSDKGWFFANVISLKS